MVQDESFRYRCYPKSYQRRELAHTFGAVRYVYNWALRTRMDAYCTRRKHVSFAQLSKSLAALKKAEGYEWMDKASSVPMQQAVRHLDAAYSNFFAGTTKHPVFHSKRGSQSAEYTTSAFRFQDGRLFLAKMGSPLKIRWSRPLPVGTKITTVTISMDAAGRYFVAFHFKRDIQPLPVSTGEVGIDVGITTLATLSTGEKIPNPRHAQKDSWKLARAQRILDRCQKDSQRREKQRLRVARIHARIANRRQDHLHKLTTRLIRENQTIAVESLAVKNMVRNHSLAKHISDAGWGEFVRQLRYKAEWNGRTLVEIDRFYPSSKRCSGCGHIMSSLPLDIRSWTCPQCGERHDRDVNAAKNILAVGHTVNARGEGVRPKRLRAMEAPFSESGIPLL